MTIGVLNQTIAKLNTDLTDTNETVELLKKEYTEKLKVLEEKNSQLKVMLHLEKPKRNSRSVTPTDSARDAKTPDREHSPSNYTRPLMPRQPEEEKSQLDISHTMIQPQSQSKLLASLREQLEDCMKKKEEVDNQIKAWIREFKKQENRYPTDTDKQPIKHLYLQHRNFKKQIESIKENMVKEPLNNNTSTILQPEVEDRNYSKSKSMSPKRAQMMRLQQANMNVSTLSMNTSFDGVSHLNTSTNEQSILQGTSFYHSSGLPMAMPNDIGKLKNENRTLREELHHLRLQTASKFEESDAVNQLRNEIQAIQRDKKFLKDKVSSLSKSLRSMQNNNETSMISANEEGERRSLDNEIYRLRMESDNRIKDLKAKHTSEIENLKQENKQQIADIIKAKDILISTMTQENQSLKDEINKHHRDHKSSSQEVTYSFLNILIQLRLLN